MGQPARRKRRLIQQDIDDEIEVLLPLKRPRTALHDLPKTQPVHLAKTLSKRVVTKATISAAVLKSHGRILEVDPEEKARLVTYCGKQKNGQSRIVLHLTTSGVLTLTYRHCDQAARESLRDWPTPNMQFHHRQSHRLEHARPRLCSGCVAYSQVFR